MQPFTSPIVNMIILDVPFIHSLNLSSHPCEPLSFELNFSCDKMFQWSWSSAAANISKTSISQQKTTFQSPGLEIMGGDSCYEGHGFESWRAVYSMVMTFFILICCKNCIVCLKRQKIKKRDPDWPIYVKTIRGWLISRAVEGCFKLDVGEQTFFF